MRGGEEILHERGGWPGKTYFKRGPALKGFDQILRGWGCELGLNCCLAAN